MELNIARSNLYPETNAPIAFSKQPAVRSAGLPGLSPSFVSAESTPDTALSQREAISLPQKLTNFLAQFKTRAQVSLCDFSQEAVGLLNPVQILNALEQLTSLPNPITQLSLKDQEMLDGKTLSAILDLIAWDKPSPLGGKYLDLSYCAKVPFSSLLALIKRTPKGSTLNLEGCDLPMGSLKILAKKASGIILLPNPKGGLAAKL
tara:strand:- start:11048 stop:11662 length:615 start_codon:yes stop_codon:yes gene_type:complete